MPRGRKYRGNYFIKMEKLVIISVLFTKNNYFSDIRGCVTELQ